MRPLFFTSSLLFFPRQLLVARTTKQFRATLRLFIEVARQGRQNGG
jgi:hypothetical protein